MTVKSIESEKIKANQGYMIRLRKTRRSLVTNGEGIIAFGAWSVFRVIMSIVVDNQGLSAILAAGLSKDQFIILLLVSLVLAVLLGMVFALHWFAGIGAYHEGHGKKTGNFYLFLIGIIIILAAAEIVMEFIPEFMGTEPFTMRFMEIVLDFTMLVMCVDTINDAFVIRSILKEFPEVDTEAGV